MTPDPIVLPAEAYEASPAGLVPTFPVRATLTQVAGLLESLDVADLSTAELVEVVAGWQQAAAIVAAHQARAVQEVLTRRTPLGDFATDELACAMVTTKAAVDVLAGRASGIAAHPCLSDALLAGTVDVRKVDIILDGTLALGLCEARDRLIVEATEVARGLTPTQLVRWLRRRVLLIDPDVARKRCEAAREDRGVELQWANDSMARLIAFLPAEDAVAAFTVIDALAGSSDDTSADRNIHQRRADAFSDLFSDILDDQVTPGGRPVPQRHGQRATLHVTAAATTLLGLDELPGELDGYGPIPAFLARELSKDATWRRIFTDPATGTYLGAGARTYRPGADLSRSVRTRDVTCTYPGCRQPAIRSELDHVVPFDKTRPAEEQTTEANLHALCKRHHQAKTKKIWNVRRDKATGNTEWTSPLGITYYRSPIPVHISPKLFERASRPRPAPDYDGDPPF
ncbi:HNH endonuclease signature motif containing protein [Cellulomonas sp. PhB150]|uniref:HNH endonuclease signature motif containing protein n=1 Tax=Cellulomonas sp. PhB150 TaxID=2485188 RepID=UPI00131580AC|nr:HNH endonuclease signature motif containing protein [Cellulomonas sp. PhB150]